MLLKFTRNRPEKEFELTPPVNQIIHKFENHNQFKLINMDIIPRQKAIHYTKSIKYQADNIF